jgi:colicin import membrane protein
VSSVTASSLATERFAEPVEPGRWAAIGLSVVMHGVLIASLLIAVQWQTRHVPLQAELWREIPREEAGPPTAPKAPQKVETPPPPAPKPVKPEPTAKPAPTVGKPPEIAIAKAKPAPASKPKPKAVETPRAPDFSGELAAAEDEIVRRRETQEKSAAAEREAKAIAVARAEAAANARARAEAEYADRIRSKIRGNIVLPPGIQGNPEAEFAVVQLPDGVVLSVRLTRSSGVPLLDQAIERAIMKSSPLPLPAHSDLFRRDLRLKYRPYES